MSDIKIGRIPLGMYQTNCYFVYREDLREAVIFDPADSGDYIYKALTDKGFSIKAIALTHGHFDHIFGVKKLKAAAECKVYALDKEEKLLGDMNLNVSVSVGRPVVVEPDILLRDNEEFSVAGITFKTLSTPGHTAGSACYYIEEAGYLIAGDTLFSGSIGRSDLPTGNGPELIESIENRIFTLPGETKVYPGHGDTTTVEFEKENNPFF
ncbi:MAG: MBL fold metallo-hydrolase [Lachnospiraceae bacterium]|nr:MBL fold metallo-hydrolase [Lachnospiraceae bacterium]